MNASVLRHEWIEKVEQRVASESLTLSVKAIKYLPGSTVPFFNQGDVHLPLDNFCTSRWHCWQIIMRSSNMLFHQLNDWLCTGLNGCVNIWHRLPPLGSIVECVIVISIMGWLLSKIYGWRPVIYSVVLAVLINLFMYVRLSAGHLPQGDAAMFALFSGFILIICLAFEALLIRDYPRLRYGLRLMMALLSGCMTLALWLQAGVRA